MNIIQSILTNNDCYKQGKALKPKGFMLHSVGCSQPKASVFIKNWNKSGVSKCVHAFIDANTGDVYQTLPWNMRGWHCGGSGNDTYIGCEMCEPDCITYTSGSNFTVQDLPRAIEFARRTYNSAVLLYAMLCHDYQVDPSMIISHSEGHAMGIASGHSDPEHLWKGLGLEYTMDGFREDVRKALGGVAPAPSSDTLYCVQVGAFRYKSNADKMLKQLKDAGFDGYITTKQK